MGYSHFYLTGHSKQFDKLAYKQEIQTKYQNAKMSERIGASVGS